VKRGVALYKAEVAPRIIMSGRYGLVTPDRIPPITEAEAMARAAIHAGVPADAIILEDESRDTIGNAYFTARRHLEPNGWTNVRVVTSDYHVPRAAWVFDKVIGDAMDVSFSPASSEAYARSVTQRALQESAIAQFLMEWIGALPRGDRDAVDRFMREMHPAYATNAPISAADITARVAEIGRGHRAGDPRAHGEPRVQDKPLEL
jgi:uncharacterized SAM-binding protein YcdF (DUF218 family)